MTVKAYDVVIIGAGIVGSACAVECAREGLSVAIVEAGIIGGGATAAGMGHLVVMDDSEAQFALTRYSQQLWDEMAMSCRAKSSTTRAARSGLRSTTKRWRRLRGRRSFIPSAAFRLRFSTRSPSRKPNRTYDQDWLEVFVFPAIA